MKKEKVQIGQEGLFDARQLGVPKMLLLGLQHTFAMFGATVLVPIITGLDVSTTLLVAGLGTLLFHLITKGRVPAFLGSSFAFLGGFSAVAPRLADGSANLEMLPYACGGVAIAGLVYVLLSLLIHAFGIERIMRFFPPVVTGPIIISIGLILSPSAVTNASQNWLLAVVALGVIIVCNIFGKGMIRIIPIILGISVSYIVAVCMRQIDFQPVLDAAWIGLPLHTSAMAKFDLNAVLMIVPIALATIMEHIGDMAAISATTGRNYIANPGLSRTLLGDGLATTMAGIFGGPANTTYGENTGVLAMTRIYDPRIMRIAACFAILLSFSPKVGALISTIPTAIIGGISFILYGMISAVGVRNVVESRVDFTKSRNLVIAAVILVSALGISSGISFAIAGYTITLSGLAIAAILGIVLNAILPGNDYVFHKDDEPVKEPEIKHVTPDQQ
ncbi:uracil-xanthine permease [Phocea massiliensis]|uniref:Uracil-xanthine permease n=1 Tax=Merdimmobilis hominis TaxID=2897707 RepID=A0A938X857_9FIRM|nr:uracil-xanthine permease family protein [Merdimmobilis hominis]MBM6921976.1 uracil-xanthine permease [Merdimmobilis hominis]